MIGVFKTNIMEKEQAQRVKESLLNDFKELAINIDLEDCDKVLRLEGIVIYPDLIVEKVKALGYHCQVMDW
ncbi:hypothetical protein [Filimonas effusa]|uniref:HMA domain-containing protein n=1 Tax=Filimonas effusa TaxID=2508721 RepID=A0A4Q1DC26_9BACT|nr:hypothetical protein [Filimonas effusa]RXK86890.1 hypothetical protein ESB13_08900 [Filimonas effusa]